MITTFTIGDEELDIDGVDGAYWHLDLLEGIEDHPSEDVMLLKEALRTSSAGRRRRSDACNNDERPSVEPLELGRQWLASHGYQQR